VEGSHQEHPSLLQDLLISHAFSGLNARVLMLATAFRAITLASDEEIREAMASNLCRHRLPEYPAPPSAGPPTRSQIRSRAVTRARPLLRVEDGRLLVVRPLVDDVDLLVSCAPRDPFAGRAREPARGGYERRARRTRPRGRHGGGPPDRSIPVRSRSPTSRPTRIAAGPGASG
jgi:hypothetical protein